MGEAAKEALATIFGVIFVIVFFLGLTWLFTGNEFFLYKYFAPKQEAVRRQVFEQTKSYNQGMIQELQNMQFEYVKATDSQKDALASIILHRTADYDETKLPYDLRTFINELKRSQYEAK